MAPGHTMVELHSNFTATAARPPPTAPIPPIIKSTRPSRSPKAGTIGSRPAFTFSPASDQTGKATNGWAITSAPVFACPEKWKWPVGVSLSLEAGYQRARFSADTWTLEIRPIIDKQIGPWYLAFNPAADRSWHGPGVRQGLDFEPGVKGGLQLQLKKSLVVLNITQPPATSPASILLANSNNSLFPPLIWI